MNSPASGGLNTGTASARLLSWKQVDVVKTTAWEPDGRIILFLSSRLQRDCSEWLTIRAYSHGGADSTPETYPAHNASLRGWRFLPVPCEART